MDAAKVPEPCKHCNEKTADHRRHRLKCKKRRRAKRSGEVVDDEAPAYSREIRFRKHKAYRGEGLPVVVDSQLYRLLRLWIRRNHPNEEDPNAPLFGNLHWYNLLTLLTRIVGKKIIAKAEGSGPIGSKAMRQYAATVILRSSATPQSAMRRIGGSETMAARHYQDQQVEVEEKVKDKEMLLKLSSSSSPDRDSDESPDRDSDESPDRDSDESDSGESDGGTQSSQVKGKLGPGQRGKSSKPVPRQTQPESSASSEEGSAPSGQQAKLSKAVRHQSSAESSASCDEHSVPGGTQAKLSKAVQLVDSLPSRKEPRTSTPIPRLVSYSSSEEDPDPSGEQAKLSTDLTISDVAELSTDSSIISKPGTMQGGSEPAAMLSSPESSASSEEGSAPSGQQAKLSKAVRHQSSAESSASCDEHSVPGGTQAKLSKAVQLVDSLPSRKEPRTSTPSPPPPKISKLEGPGSNADAEAAEVPPKTSKPEVPGSNADGEAAPSE